MNILAVSLWLRYLQIANEPVVFPANAYKGEYVREIAQELWQQEGAQYVRIPLV